MVVPGIVRVIVLISCLSSSSQGVSMSLLESKDGLHVFAFEHSRDYQQVQFKFFDAVESMDPNNIVVNKSGLVFYYDKPVAALQSELAM